MSKSKNSESSQSQKFMDSARELECADNEDRFKDALRKIAKAPPAKQEPHPKPKKSK